MQGNMKKTEFKGTPLKFEGFTQETGDFFWELMFNNERPWFQAHKEQFMKVLYNPFKALAAETETIVQAEHPLENLEVHASRIYRDARRLYGKGPYKDSLWFSIKDRSNVNDGPGFFFEITPRSWCYGMGYYCMKPAEMEGFRKSIDAEPERFRQLAQEIENLGRFIIEGEEYKKPKGDYGETVNKWYNRKWISATRDCNFGDELFSSELPRMLASEFSLLMPMYRYLKTFCREA